MKQITLANLTTSTAQEVFDWVAHNLLKQMVRSQDQHGLCLYRGRNGTKCGAGFCIADEEYKEEMEGSPWCALKVPPEHGVLISDLQIIHDRESPENWREELKNLAEKEGLEFKE